MTLNSNGFTTNSSEKFIIDAGAVYLNTTFAAGAFTGGTLLGATSGGNEFVIQQEIRQIEVDGAKGRTKGLQVVTFQNPVLTVNLKEMTAQNLAKAITGANVDTADTAYDIITSSGQIDLTDYISNVTLVGKLLNGKQVVIVVENVLQIEGLEMTFEDNNEVVVPVAFAGHYEAGSTQAPFKIYFAK